MTSEIVNEQLLLDLQNIGVRLDKPLYVRAALGSIGRVKGGLKSVLLPTLRQAVGEGGTLIAPHFTSACPVWVREPANSKEISSGALSKIILQDSSAMLSEHDTHSFVALGQLSETFTAVHHYNGACFEPIRKVIEHDGDMLLVGCVGSSPGFSTVHLAQHDLGILRHHYYRYLIRGLWQHSGVVESRKVYESPGCSLGFGKFYSEYMQHGLLSCGYVGNAFAILINSKKAYELEYELLKSNRKFYICSNTDCVSCRLLNGNNLYDIPASLLANTIKIIKRYGRGHSKNS